MSVGMIWKSGMKFEGIGRFSTPIVADESKRTRGNEGEYSPVEFVLSA